jgi:hypothetical protein
MQEWQEGDRVAVTKFNRQADDLGAVYLYKEGLFVRAYNEGAYAFISQVLVCKPVRRFIKYAGADRVVCGVPLAVATKLPGFAQASQVDKLTWRWPLTVPVERKLYDAWRESLPLVMPSISATAAEAAALPAEDLAQRLMDRLMQFNVAASTPVAALNLVADLQQQWQEREVS